MKRIAIFASGNGSNFQAIVDAFEKGALDGRPALCVCDKPQAFVIERAKKAGIPLLVAAPKDFESKAEYEKHIGERLEAEGIDLICLAGYMRIIGPVLLEKYGGRIINIHPSLLPAFKGAHAIRDAFEYGVKVFGVTIHFVNETLDGGKIISQEAVPYTGNDIEELEGMIHKVEHHLYPSTINMLLKETRD